MAKIICRILQFLYARRTKPLIGLNHWICKLHRVTPPDGTGTVHRRRKLCLSGLWERWVCETTFTPQEVPSRVSSEELKDLPSMASRFSLNCIPSLTRNFIFTRIQLESFTIQFVVAVMIRELCNSILTSNNYN